MLSCELFGLFKKAANLKVPGMDEIAGNAYRFMYNDFIIVVSENVGFIHVNGYYVDKEKGMINLNPIELLELRAKVEHGIKDWVRFLEEEIIKEEMKKVKEQEASQKSERRIISEKLNELPFFSTMCLN